MEDKELPNARSWQHFRMNPPTTPSVVQRNPTNRLTVKKVWTGNPAPSGAVQGAQAGCRPAAPFSRMWLKFNRQPGFVLVLGEFSGIGSTLLLPIQDLRCGSLRWADFWIKVQGFKSQELASVVNIGNQSVCTFLSPTNPKNQPNTSRTSQRSLPFAAQFSYRSL